MPQKYSITFADILYLFTHQQTIFTMDTTKRKKTGGRQKGTPNKTTHEIRTVIAKMIDDYYYSEKFAKDIEELEPRERVQAMEKLLQYSLPKLQNTTLDVAMEKKHTIEDRLIELSDEESEE